jgi:Domain of unknown function (DUF6468)
MTGAILNLLVNIIMAVLLAVTISYCWMLNRRIQILQDSKSELSQLLKHFDESTQRASESIIALQTASKKIGEGIQLKIDKANYLLDDLAHMLERGSVLSDKLEADMAVSRAKDRVAAEEMTEPRGEFKAVPPTPTAKEKTRSSLEAMLERLSGRTKPAWPAMTKEEAAVAARSRAEQELRDLLKAGGLKG